MERSNFQKLHVYGLAERLADTIWETVVGWERFAKDTVGKQLVRAADSVGANIAEGSARGTFQDNRRFVRIARGSLSEVQHWLRRAFRRGLLRSEDAEVLSVLVNELAPRLNAYLKSIGTIKSHGTSESPSHPPTDN